MYPVYPLVMQNLSRLPAINTPFWGEYHITPENQSFTPTFM